MLSPQLRGNSTAAIGSMLSNMSIGAAATDNDSLLASKAPGYSRQQQQQQQQQSTAVAAANNWGTSFQSNQERCNSAPGTPIIPMSSSSAGGVSNTTSIAPIGPPKQQQPSTNQQQLSPPMVSTASSSDHSYRGFVGAGRAITPQTLDNNDGFNNDAGTSSAR